jgi:hypothetical protein
MERYVGAIAKFATEVLGTTQSNDKGFDMEFGMINLWLLFSLH